jgi:hypothetical protein
VKGRIDARRMKIKIGTGRIEELFQQLVLERLKSWVTLAEERLTDSGVQLFISPGNDDIAKIEEVLAGSRYVVCAADNKVHVKDYEMVSLSYSNPTPWETPRECSEEELARKIDSLACGIGDMEKAIFNFHIPPYGTMLDIAPKISDNLTMSGSETSNVGSKAVLEAIKKYQPLLGLHGHIHESKAIHKIGRTTCVNPGSEYTEGTLKGVIITIDDKNIKNHMFTSG